MAKRSGKGERSKTKRGFSDFQQEAMRQFRGIDPNDPGQWPLIPRMAAYLALIVLVIFAAWFVVISDKKDELETAENAEVKLKEEFKEKIAKAVHINKLQEIKKNVEGYVQDLEGRLPNESQIDELVKDISASGIQNGLEFTSLKPEQHKETEYYIEQPITMKALSPGYNNVAYFAQKLAELRRIVTLTDIKLVPADMKDLQINGEQLIIEATLRTYRYMSPEEQQLVRQREQQKNAKGGQ